MRKSAWFPRESGCAHNHQRMELKALVKFKGDKWDKRQNVLKWLLVTCFGYTGYRNARFGRIECMRPYVLGPEKFYWVQRTLQKKRVELPTCHS